MRRTLEGSHVYINQRAKQVGVCAQKYLSYILTKKLLVLYDILFQEKIQQLIATESQDESGN